MREQRKPVQQLEFVVLVVFIVESAPADAQPVEFVQQFKFGADSRASAAADPQFFQQFFEFVEQFLPELQLPE